MVESTLVGFPLSFIQTPIMSKKMTSTECFDAIDFSLENLKGVANAVRNIQNEEIPKLFQRAQEWESLEHWITILEADTRVGGKGISDAP